MQPVLTVIKKHKKRVATEHRCTRFGSSRTVFNEDAELDAKFVPFRCDVEVAGAAERSGAFEKVGVIKSDVKHKFDFVSDVDGTTAARRRSAAGEVRTGTDESTVEEVSSTAAVVLSHV